MTGAAPGLTRSGKPRLHYIDFMKGICIILIVGFHVDNDIYPGQANPMLQAFRVPLYYFLSGLFFKDYGGIAEFARRKTNNILVPFLFFYLGTCAIAMVMTCVLHLDERGLMNDPFRWQYIFDPLTVRNYHYAVALWFLLSIFEVNMIYLLLARLLRGAWLWLAVAAISAGGWLLADAGIILPLMLDTAFVGIPFFALGAALKQFGLLGPSRYDRWGLIVFPLTCLILYYCAEPLNIFDQVLPSYLLLYSLTFLAIVSLFWFAKGLPRVPVVTYIGQYSLIVLGTHSMILTPVRKIIFGTCGESYLTYWLVLLVLMLMELALIPLMTRLFPRMTAQKDLIPPRGTIKGEGKR